MANLLEYVFEEVRQNRTPKTAALEFLRRLQEHRARAPSLLHPLLQRDLSGHQRQRFSSEFTGREFFLTDHLVNGKKVLPGVVYLEMARAAAALALRERPPNLNGHGTAAHVLSLRKVVWSRPIVVRETPVTAQISLRRDQNETIHYEISTRVESFVGTPPEGESGGVEIHCRGTALLGTGEAPLVDLRKFEASCSETIPAARCYATFLSMGIEYGPAHQALECVKIGTCAGARFVLGQLRLPVAVCDTYDEYVLHPSAMDAVFQAAAGLLSGSPQGAQSKAPPLPALPFAVESMEIWGPCPPRAFAIVVDAVDSTAEVRKVDVDVCDESGVVCVRVRGLSARTLLEPIGESASDVSKVGSSGAVESVLRLIPVWDAVVVGEGELSPGLQERVLICGGSEGHREQLRQQYSHSTVLGLEEGDDIGSIAGKVRGLGPIDQVVWIAPLERLGVQEEGIIEAQSRGVMQCFRLLKGLLEAGYGSRALGVSVITWQSQGIVRGEKVEAAHASVHGLMGSVAKEYAHWKVRVVDLGGEYWESWPLGPLLRLAADAQGSAWGYRGGQWYRQRLIRCEGSEAGAAELEAVEAPETADVVKAAEAADAKAAEAADGVKAAEAADAKAAEAADGVKAAEATDADAAETADAADAAAPRYRRGGVYVVIGGAGGLGEVWSEYMIERYQARIIWIGRREAEDRIKGKQDRLSQLGVRPEYFAADARDRVSLQRAYEQIKQRYGSIHGVVDAAIVLLDSSLEKMTEERFREALSAKVDVGVRVAQVFAQEPLELFLVFSSLQSFGKAAGQSNYAAGCTFKDAHALRWGAERGFAVKVMNWGYWGSVGVVSSPEYRQRMRQAGFGSIEAEEGMRGLQGLVRGPFSQEVYLKITDARLEEHICERGERLCRVGGEEVSPSRWLREVRVPPSPLDELSEEQQQQLLRLDELLGRLLWVQLRGVGLIRDGELLEESSARVGLPAAYRGWVKESLRVLSERGYVQLQEGRCRVPEAVAAQMEGAWQSWDERKAQWLRGPELQAQVKLVEVTLRALPQVLSEQVAATEVMFPDSSMALVEGIYQHNRQSDYFNEALCAQVMGYVRGRLGEPGAARLRILEIGAGTGGTSARLIGHLHGYADRIEEYAYTDVSKAFLMHGKKQYGHQAPYLRCQLFDVERSVQEQGFRLGSYDVVIATNVLHATRDIRRSVRNAKGLLKRNGLLVLNELAGRALFTHLTFGLLPGWWAYEDAPLRIEGTPGLHPHSWERVLQGEGFGSIGFPAEAAHALGQQIIVAESDGIIRQSHRVAPPARAVAVRSSGNGDVRHSNARTGLPGASGDEQPRITAKADAAPARAALCMALKDKLARELTESLQLEPGTLESDRSFADYGLDSIIGVKIVNTLNSQLSIDLNPTSLFEHTSVDALIEHILARYPDLQLPAGERMAVPPEAADGSDDIPSSLPMDARERLINGPQQAAAVQPSELRVSQGTASFRDTDIAIIGMSGRFPGARDIDAYWDNLVRGVDCVTEVPPDRWPLAGFFHEDPAQAVAKGLSYSKWGGFIPGVNEFDPDFFEDDPPLSAHARHFLEVVWHLLEDAGYTREALQRQYGARTGVYLGAISGGTTLSTGSIAIAAARFFNCQGPCLAVDTMSSSAMTAIHLACEGLARGDCEVAIVGGECLLSPPKYFINSYAHALGTDADSRSFTGANGITLSECVAAVLLKPLARAVEDRDRVLAVIKSTTAKHAGGMDGKMVPNTDVYTHMIADTFQRAAIDPRTISYVEAAAAGMAMADRLEIAMLSKAFQKFTPTKNFCPISTVKTYIGHAEAGSAMSQLTKVILQLQHRELIPLSRLGRLDASLMLDDTPFYFQRQREEWRRPTVSVDGHEREAPRRALINSLGAGGSYASLILEEYIAPEAEPPGTSASHANRWLIVLSAKSRHRLAEMARRLLAHIGQADCDLPGLAFTLQVGREPMAYRVAMIVQTQAELVSGLSYCIRRRSQSAPVPFFSGKRAVGGTATSGNGSDAPFNGRNPTEQTLEAIAARWVHGAEVTWSALYPAPPAKVRLPGYPFQRRKIVEAVL